jgi:hypothetical protein
MFMALVRHLHSFQHYRALSRRLGLFLQKLAALLPVWDLDWPPTKLRPLLASLLKLSAAAVGVGWLLIQILRIWPH